MYDTICYFGFSAHDFTEISAARKEHAPGVELRFFTAAAELVEHISYSHATRTLVFLDTRALDAEWELIRRIKSDSDEANGNVQVILLSTAYEVSEHERAPSCGVAAYLRSPVQPETLRHLFSCAP